MSPNTTAWTPPSGEPPQPPPRKSWPRRHPVWTIIGSLAGLSIIIGIASAVAAPAPSGTQVATPTTSVPDYSGASPGTLPPAPPAANPKASGSGSCDVSLSDALYGQDYLTASVDVDNTGNIAQVVEVTVRWPQQGFAPITRHKQARVPVGQTRTVNLHAPVTSEQVGRFQDRQLATDGDPCHYRLDLISTYGPVQS